MGERTRRIKKLALAGKAGEGGRRRRTHGPDAEERRTDKDERVKA